MTHGRAAEAEAIVAASRAASAGANIDLENGAAAHPARARSHTPLAEVAARCSATSASARWSGLR